MERHSCQTNLFETFKSQTDISELSVSWYLILTVVQLTYHRPQNCQNDNQDTYKQDLDTNILGKCSCQTSVSERDAIVRPISQREMQLSEQNLRKMQFSEQVRTISQKFSCHNNISERCNCQNNISERCSCKNNISERCSCHTSMS